MTSSFHTKKNNNILVVDAGYGLGAVAARDLVAGEVIGTLTGRVQAFADVPTDDICYLFPAGGKDLWLYPDAPERFLNHSCEPNVAIVNLFTMVAKRDIPRGDVLAFAYDEVSKADMDWLKISEMSDSFLRWPAAFGFVCQCHQPNCRRRIDRNYVVDSRGVRRPQTSPEVQAANRRKFTKIKK